MHIVQNLETLYKEFRAYFPKDIKSCLPAAKIFFYAGVTVGIYFVANPIKQDTNVDSKKVSHLERKLTDPMPFTSRLEDKTYEFPLTDVYLSGELELREKDRKKLTMKLYKDWKLEKTNGISDQKSKVYID